ncbi:ubiquitin carboxyl-terminal hydrolase 43 [Hirundo rustica]|uniref:ubiquitin carboxyl-terminal hydrolase 43 n=1 Tax=Hirundo rustica TaxID=43150 RepID=UPI00267133CB|nr:ubiquitin carboxyl-terminal hydrolase 43 [Hirundo rustica]
MNAVVQCLSNTAPLAERLALGRYRARGEVTQRLAALVRALWTRDYTPQLSAEFKNIVSKHSSQFRGNAQHDALEFLLWLLDRMHEDLGAASPAQPGRGPTPPGKDGSGGASRSPPGTQHPRGQSFVQSHFQAQYRSSLTCPHCLKQSNTFDPFLCISLPIPLRQTRNLGEVAELSSPLPSPAKVQEEIDAVVGTGRAPSTEDKLRMPYTNAVIHELQRFHKTRIENFPRMTTQDVLFRGYTIPKGTPVIPVISSVHSDPTQWENPRKVDPAHFLDEKGEFRKREAFMAFSAGKRMCPGEALARIELFLFLTTLLQSFTFQLATEHGELDLFSLWLEIERRAIPGRFFAIPRSLSS